MKRNEREELSRDAEMRGGARGERFEKGCGIKVTDVTVKRREAGEEI